MKDVADKAYLKGPTMQQRVAAAIAALGPAYVLHPAYRRAANPAHSYPGAYTLRRVRGNAIIAGRI